MVTPVRAVWVMAATLVLTAVGSVRTASANVWPSSHQRVADSLGSDDVSVRRNAASKLLTLPPKLAQELARTALRDGDVEVRIFAARAAAALGVDKAGDEVVDWLQDRDARLRVAACELIEASPTPRSVQSLARVLGDAQTSVRRAAAAAMGGSGSSDAVSPLLGHLDDGAQTVRIEVVRALGRIGDKRAVVPLVSKLQDQEAEVRREAARALGQLGDSRAASTLMLALQDKSVGVQVQALEALGELKAGGATVAIAALLSDETGSTTLSAARGAVRDAALRALGRIGSAQAVRLLIEALEGEGPVPLDGMRPAPVRDALALAGEAALAALVSTLSASPSRQLGSGAVLTLATMGDAKAMPHIVRATQRGIVDLDAGLRALGALGHRGALPFVLEHLDDGDGRVRQTSVEVATRLLDPRTRDGRAVDVVRSRVLDLTTPVPERMALVKLLGRTGSPRAQKLLLSLVDAKSPALRVAVVEALGLLGDTSAAVDDALLRALAEPSSRLRVAAARAIGSVGKDDAARKLLHRLGVAAEQDRGALGVGLSGALGRSRDPALVQLVGEALRSAPASARDALIEGLGRMGTKQASAMLATMHAVTDPNDRRKVAEALGGHVDGETTLLRLASDPDPAVRANAVWSLGKVGADASLAVLVSRLEDLDVAVAGNAAVALAAVARRSGKLEMAESLCGALADDRAYVRAGALTGLRLAGVRCEGGGVRHLLRRDSAWRTRLAAGRLLRSQLSGDADDRDLDRRALRRCAVEDRDATVARFCTADALPPDGTHDVLVYVVPDGSTSPAGRAPFALVLADGSMRLGVADRRGALFELAAPGGVIELAVPAAQAP